MRDLALAGGHPLLGRLAFEPPVEKQVQLQRLPRLHRIGRNVDDARRLQHFHVEEEVAGCLLRRARQDQVGSVRHDLRRARTLHQRVASEQVLHGGGGDGGLRPERIDRDAVSLQLFRQPQRAHAHAVLGERVSQMRAEPARLHGKRRRKRQDVRVGGLLQMRQSVLGTEKRAARIDLMHQVKPLHLQRLGAAQVDGAGIVDQDVDAAKMADGFVNRRLHLGFVADVAGDSQSLAAGGDEIGRGTMDGAGQFRVFRLGLGGNHDVGPVGSGSHGDGVANAA